MSAQALQASPSEKILELSKAKKLAEGYKPSRGPQWKVGKGALNAVTSTRYYTCIAHTCSHLFSHIQDGRALQTYHEGNYGPCSV